MSGERSSLAALLERHASVRVPIIQRDYAQGRLSELELRTAFLLALRDALLKPEDDPTLPLDLDFVYGSVDADGAFNPLDGQQRLTTLLLLHWYLAAKEDRFVDFARKPPPGRGSRFTYAVRSSSREFFDGLIEWRPTRWRKLSEELGDQPWFFLRWKLDPTIQSALNMLDAIHETFADARCSYQRLTSADRPAITFQLLDLRDFGLSDDLYIKMNARGKPLTAFESFKAQLEEHIDAVLPQARFELEGTPMTAREYFSHRIDTAWTDVLWHYRDPKTALSDDGFMNLVRALATVSRREGQANPGRLIDALRDRREVFSFARYAREACLDAEFVLTLIALLDAWVGGEAGVRPQLLDEAIFNERTFAEKLFADATALTYEQLLQFGAYSAFIHRNPQGDPKAFGEWMRVMRNLSVNTPYDRAEDLIRSLQSMRDLLSNARDILTFLTSIEAKDMRGFYGQQQAEERMKAWLIQRGDAWRNAIESAERHGYFAGQIEFLLDFAEVRSDWDEDKGFDWLPKDDTDHLQAFISYRDKAFAIFAEDGLDTFPDFLWERALLAQGDYLLDSGSNNSLLNNAGRDESWKRLLRGGSQYWAAKRVLVRKALDVVDISIGVAASLARFIESCEPDDEWRRLLVRYPKALAYCSRRYVRKAGGNHVYLMGKIRMSGAHAELLTYVLYLRLSERGQASTRNAYLSYAAPDTDATEPYTHLAAPGRSGLLSILVLWSDGELRVILSAPPKQGSLPSNVVDELLGLGFIADGQRFLIDVALDEAERIVIDLTERATAWDLATA